MYFITSSSKPLRVPPGSLSKLQITELCLYSYKLIKTKNIMKSRAITIKKIKEIKRKNFGFLSDFKTLQQQ